MTSIWRYRDPAYKPALGSIPDTKFPSKHDFGEPRARAVQEGRLRGRGQFLDRRVARRKPYPMFYGLRSSLSVSQVREVEGAS